MKTLQLKNIVWNEGKYFVAQCMNVDVSSFGDSKEEALKNLDEALALYFEDEKGQSFQQIEKPEIIDSEFSSLKQLKGYERHTTTEELKDLYQLKDNEILLMDAEVVKVVNYKTNLDE